MSEKYNSENFNHGKITDLDLAKEVRTSFLDYSMSVIVSRALPDVKDGLKPVHRRILYAMNDLGITADKPHKKSARITGEVIGKYHPHGDVAVYDTMVRMAQDFNYRYPLVDGHGNFGSIDGDGAAAMRYTESRMSKISMELLKDIQKDTIDWKENYDGEEKEPVVLPARFPNLLVNGSTGIAVGMATNVAPHNLIESINAAIAVIENPEITVKELMDDYIYGPDFPTGAYILGRSGIKQSFETGRGSIVMRAKAEIDVLDNGKPRIIIHEIPYIVNKAKMVEKIADLVRDKIIEGITDLRDESNMEGLRVVIECRKDVQPEVLLNQLYKLTPLQSTFGVNNVILVNGTPKQLGLKEILHYYIEHQIDVTERRTRFDLRKAEDRAHILEGLLIALDDIDRILETIRSSKDANEALLALINNFGLTEIQARAILDMQFKRLTGLERQKIVDEHTELVALITDLKDILSNHSRVLEIIKTELTEIKNKYGDERRSEIIDADVDMEDEELIPVEDIIVTMTMNGYIKRITADTYRVQNRGGKGVKGMAINEDDVIDQLVNMSTHDYLLFFTNLGKVYRIMGYNVPSASRIGKGIPVVNLINLEKDEKVTALVPILRDNEKYKYLFFVTKLGIVKRVTVDNFYRINKNGKIAIIIDEGDELVRAKITTGEDDIIIASSDGQAIRFNENKVRSMGRQTRGVKGFDLDGAHVVGFATSDEGDTILSITENGYGKKSMLEDFRLTNRGGKGVKTIKISERNGSLVSMRTVTGEEDCMIVTDDGIIIRISLKQVPVLSRNTQGVKLINVANGSKVCRVAIIESSNDETTESIIEQTAEEELEDTDKTE